MQRGEKKEVTGSIGPYTEMHSVACQSNRHFFFFGHVYINLYLALILFRIVNLKVKRQSIVFQNRKQYFFAHLTSELDF